MIYIIESRGRAEGCFHYDVMMLYFSLYFKLDDQKCCFDEYIKTSRIIALRKIKHIAETDDALHTCRLSS